MNIVNRFKLVGRILMENDDKAETVGFQIKEARKDGRIIVKII